MSEGEAVALIHKVMMRIIMMIITEYGYIFIHIDHQKIESKIDKSQDSKVCETRPTLVCPMLYTCVPLLHFDSMTMMIWPHPPHIAPYIYLWRSNRTHQGDDKDTSTDECDGADDLFTDASSICGGPHRGRLRFAGFRLPTCQAFTFWGISNVSNGQTKPKSVFNLVLVVLGTSRQD